MVRRAFGLGILALGLGLCALGVDAESQSTPPAANPEVTFRIIVVSSIEQADQIAARVRQGEDFAALAKQLSLDPSSRAGGLIGPVALSELRAELRDALQAMREGEVSGVLVIPTGFAFVQRVARAAETAARNAEALAFSAASGVKATISVDGLSEVQTALFNLPKPANWNQSPQLICQYRNEAIDQVTSALSRVLAPDAAALRADYTESDLVDAHTTLAQLYVFFGKMGEALAEYEQAYRLVSAGNPALLPDLDQAIGAALVHKAEMDNGIYATPGDRCLLSSRPRSALAKPDDLASAAKHFLAILERSPDDLEARWLLNASQMSTGGYPSRVPPRYLIPTQVFESQGDVGRFVDMAAASGVTSFSMAGGVVVDDFDNDGQMDILTSNSDRCAPLQLFHREAGGMFVDRTEAAGLAGQLGGLNVSQADYDNDGCVDVLLMRGGWDLPQRRSLLHNNCDGTFTDVTASAGLQTPVTSSQTAAWADIDNDGWLDLFVGNEDAPAQLFHNRRDGTFVDIAPSAGVARSAFTKGVTAGDIDNDGFPDFYVSNFQGANFLYRNNGNLTFTDVSASAGVRGADRGFTTWFFDYDNDGRDDLFAASYFLSIEEAARAYLKQSPNASPMRLYRNLGNGRFVDVTEAVGLNRALMVMGANFGDVDNDGFLDIYLGTGSPSYVSLVPSMLLRNVGGASFADITVSSGTGEMHKGHGVAFVDLDGDGDEEIVFKVGGATPGDAHGFRLFENPGQGNDWLGVKLVGVRSNRGAIGARITVTVEGADGARRDIHRTVTSGGSFGASPLEQHIGLGKSARPVSVGVYWPASRTSQSFANVPKNQVIQIREMADRFTPVNRPALPLGGKKN